MPIKTTRAERKALLNSNLAYSEVFREIPRSVWPSPNAPMLSVWRNNRFLVQVYDAPPPAFVRLSVNRTLVKGDRWADGITWDELQEIKSQMGYGKNDAIEIYPPDVDVVNVANIRHLWVLREPISFAWRSTPKEVSIIATDMQQSTTTRNP